MLYYEYGHNHNNNITNCFGNLGGGFSHSAGIILKRARGDEQPTAACLDCDSSHCENWKKHNERFTRAALCQCARLLLLQQQTHITVLRAAAVKVSAAPAVID